MAPSWRTGSVCTLERLFNLSPGRPDARATPHEIGYFGPSRRSGANHAVQSFRSPVTSGHLSDPGNRHHRIERHRLALGRLGRRWPRRPYCVPAACRQRLAAVIATMRCVERVACECVPSACAGEMAVDRATWAGSMHVLEGWLGSTVVTYVLISPEAVIATGASIH